MNDNALIHAGIKTLQEKAGAGAKASGWHKDRPEQFHSETGEQYAVRLRNWQGMKMMLMVSEVSEAVEELRAGKTADETYYPAIPEGAKYSEAELDAAIRGKHKPEGVPSELADVVIRIMDFCYTEGIDLASMILEKLAFNQTRGQRHGGKAI